MGRGVFGCCLMFVAYVLRCVARCSRVLRCLSLPLSLFLLFLCFFLFFFVAASSGSKRRVIWQGRGIFLWFTSFQPPGTGNNRRPSYSGERLFGSGASRILIAVAHASAEIRAIGAIPTMLPSTRPSLSDIAISVIQTLQVSESSFQTLELIRELKSGMYPAICESP